MRIYTVARPMFWSALAVAFVMAVLPQDAALQLLPSDKLQHMLAFFTMAVLGRLAYPTVPVLTIGAGLAGYGALIELVQLIPALNRSGDWADLVADLVALTVGLSLSRYLQRRRWEKAKAAAS